MQSYIFELANYLANNKISQGNPSGRRKDDADLLWEGIVSEQFGSDEEAMLHLYGNKNHARKYYERTKRLLRKRLINHTLIKASPTNLTDIQRVYKKCYKSLTAVKILRGAGKRKSALAIAESTFKTATKYHLTEVALSLASELQLHYGIIDSNQKKFEHYTVAVEQQTLCLLSEQKAQKYYCSLIQHFSKSKANQIPLLPQLQVYQDDLAGAIENGADTFYVRFIHFYLGFFYYQIINEYETLIESCQSALHYFHSLPYTPPNAGFIACYFQMAPAYIKLGQFKAADLALSQCLELVHPKSYDWIACQQNLLMLRFHSGEYKDCYDIVQKVKKLEPYDAIKEQWRIYEAYVTFLALVGKIDAKNVKRFRIGKFINEVPIYNKDKRGMNVNILILQILFLLQRSAYPQIIERAEALKRYSSRYLRKNDTFRSNCFIKMLLVLPQTSFQITRIERHVAPLLEKLSEVKLDLQDHEVEIIPYETLWELIIELLSQKTQSTRLGVH